MGLFSEMQNTYAEYEAWREDGTVPADVKQGYERATTKLQTIVSFENALVILAICIRSLTFGLMQKIKGRKKGLL